jgi:hypothetical protein
LSRGHALTGFIGAGLLGAGLLGAGLLAPAIPVAAQTAAAQTAAPAATPPTDGGGRFQIVKATDQRVWRLDRESGVISVCTLEGDRLVCTDSTEAARPTPKDYEALRKAEAERAAADRERQMALVDRMLAFVREMMAMSGGTDPAAAK